MPRYQISTTRRNDHFVEAKAWYDRPDPKSAIRAFFFDFPHVGQAFDFYAGYDLPARWPGKYTDLYCEIDEHKSWERLTTCEVCGAPATWAFHFEAQGGTELDMQLCRRCSVPKTSAGIIRMANSIYGGKPRSRTWWLKRPEH